MKSQDQIEREQGQKAIEAIDVINDRMKAHFTFEEKVVRIGLILERYYKGEEKDGRKDTN